MRIGTGRFATGGPRDGAGDLRRVDVYSDEALWRARYDRVLDDRDLWRMVLALSPFAVRVPVGELPTARRDLTRPADLSGPLPPVFPPIPWPRPSPDGAPTRPRRRTCP